MEALEPRAAYVFVSHRAHFLDPLVDEQWAALADCEAAGDPAVLRIVEEVLPRHCTAPRIFFPVPMERALRETEGDEGDGDAEAAVVERFHYDLVHVDDEQRWSWRGRPVGERARRFFLEQLRWCERVGRWLFEYKVHDGWWDKSYLDAVVTPLVAIRLEEEPDAGRAVAHLASGQAGAVDLDSFRLDARERLFCRVEGMGEVMFSDTERFRIVASVSDDLETVEVAGARRVLRWPVEEGAP